MIINTLGWVDGKGYDLQRHVISAFKVSSGRRMRFPGQGLGGTRVLPGNRMTSSCELTSHSCFAVQHQFLST